MIRSRRGETTPVARITDDVAPGVLYMAMHFPNGANNLTNTALDRCPRCPNETLCCCY